jgi:hypothetical protein
MNKRFKVSKFSKVYNVSFWQISVMYEVKFGVKLPGNKSYGAALREIKAIYVAEDNESGFGWMVEQSKLCQNANLDVAEAVKVINGRIAYDDEYNQEVKGA